MLVEVRRRSDALEVAVRNGPGDGTPAAGPGPTDGPTDGPSGGHGLVGMRERAALHNGSVRTGPTDDGGFAVLARLALPAPVGQGEQWQR